MTKRVQIPEIWKIYKTVKHTANRLQNVNKVTLWVHLLSFITDVYPQAYTIERKLKLPNTWTVRSDQQSVRQRHRLSSAYNPTISVYFQHKNICLHKHKWKKNYCYFATYRKRDTLNTSHSKAAIACVTSTT